MVGLVDNTEQVLDQYGQFFSKEKKLSLEVLLVDAVAQAANDNVPQVILNLGEIANGLQRSSIRCGRRTSR